MMFWFDRHRRFRDQLSAYIDGELDAAAAERLESHLAQCGRCRTELSQLRATVAGLRDLPEVEPPRSFTLSPERIAAPRPRPPAASPLAFGARIAAAGLAAALAAVLVVDLAGVGGNGAMQEATAPQTTMERSADEGGMETAAGAPGPETGAAETPAVPAEGGLLPDSGAAAETPAAGGAGKFGMTGAAETPAAGPEEAEEAEAPVAAPSGGGIDSLTAAEIGLAAALGVLVAGSLAFTLAGRKR